MGGERMFLFRGVVSMTSSLLARCVPSFSCRSREVIDVYIVIEFAPGGPKFPLLPFSKDKFCFLAAGVDIVLDPLGGSDTQKGFGLLKPLGTLITFGEIRREFFKTPPTPAPPYPPVSSSGAANILTGQKRSLLALAKTWYQQLSLGAVKLMQSNRSVGGFHLGFLTDEGLIRATLAKLVELYRQGKIRPRVDSRYHFEEVGPGPSNRTEDGLAKGGRGFA